MFEFTLIDDGDGFKAAMGVFTDTARGFCEGELMGAGIVEEEEGIELFSVLIGEEAADGEAVTDPVLGDIADDVSDGFQHETFPAEHE